MQREPGGQAHADGSIKSVWGYKRPCYKVGRPTKASPNQLQRQLQQDEAGWRSLWFLML